MSALRIALVSLYTVEIEEEGRLMEKNAVQYTDKHGYGWECCYTNLDKTRHPVWSKLLWLKKVMESYKYDWLMWKDADSFIMNDCIRIESILAGCTDDTDVVVTEDRWTGFNAGHFLIRCNPWSIRFLDRIFHGYPECLLHSMREQEAMRLDMMRPDVVNHVQWVHKSVMNSYLCPQFGHQFSKGDFILHFAGYTTNRLHLMQRFADPNDIDFFETLKARLFFVQCVLFVIVAYLCCRTFSSPLVMIVLIVLALLSIYCLSFGISYLI